MNNVLENGLPRTNVIWRYTFGQTDAHAIRTNDSSLTSNDGYAQRLNGGENERFGLGRSLSVMPGDKITAEVYAKYLDPDSVNRTQGLKTLLSQIAQQIATGATSSGLVKDGQYFGTSTTSFPFPMEAGQNTTGSSGSGPKAYLNWLVFDRHYSFLLAESGYMRLSDDPKETGQDVDHERLFSPQIEVKQPGYVYIYLSNENETPVEVYFDDFSVEHIKSPVVQMDNYYPFGLTFNSYQRENSVEQRWKFQGQEHISDLGLNWDSFKWRNHQPDIGRFFNIDPLAEKYYYNSPYAFSENKVVAHVELEGLEAWPIMFFSRPAPVVRPVVETVVKTNGSGRTTGQGLQNAARVGRQTHGEELPKWQSEGYQTEVKIGEGNRVDGIKIEQNQDGTSTGFVRELKPNTPSGKTRGLKQLERYIDTASKKNPEVTDWQPELTLYQLLAPTANTEGTNSETSTTGDGPNNESNQGSTNALPQQVPAQNDATRVAPAFDPTQVNPPCEWSNCI